MSTGPWEENAKLIMARYEDDNVRDALADLMHYCADYGIDFEQELRVARTHCAAERGE